MNDYLGLKKLEKDLNKSLNFDIGFKEEKTRNKSQKKRQNNPRQQTKPILTKHQQTEAKKFIKETGSAFSGIISNIKNRKIRKLEKEAMKNAEKARALAHEIKTRTANNDALTDIARYEKELEKIKQEEKQ